MIRGTVNTRLEATVSLTIVAPADGEIELTAIIDTGYTGALAIPKSMAIAHGFPPSFPVQVKLGDGSRKALEFFEGEVVWNGQKRLTRMLATADECLIGLKLLEDHRLDVSFRVGEPVYIMPG